MGRVLHLGCPRCGARYPAEPGASARAGCGVVLDIAMELDGLAPGLAASIRARPRWRKLLPVEEPGAQALLAERAGVFAEPSGAASVAAAIRLRREGVIGGRDLVVCVVTGHGLKQPEAPAAAAPAPIALDLEALRALLTDFPRP